MESLDVLMDRTMKLLMEVDQKNSLVDEGVRKLENCSQQVLKFRVDQRKVQEERRDELTAAQRENHSKAFKLEQLDEKLAKIVDSQHKMAVEHTKLDETITKKIDQNSFAGQEKHQKMVASRRELDERLLKLLPTN